MEYDYKTYWPLTAMLTKYFIDNKALNTPGCYYAYHVQINAYPYINLMSIVYGDSYKDTQLSYVNWLKFGKKRLFLLQKLLDDNTLFVSDDGWSVNLTHEQCKQLQVTLKLLGY